MNWRTPLQIISLSVISCLVSISDVRAERRVALVIGNGDYTSVEKLPNPTRDADAIADVLRELNFDVLKGINLDRDAMVEIIAQFEGRSSNADVALIFYAGHAVQIDSQSYLCRCQSKPTCNDR